MKLATGKSLAQRRLREVFVNLKTDTPPPSVVSSASAPALEPLTSEMLDQEPAVGGKVEGDRGSQAQKLGASELEQNVGAERAQTRYKPQPTEGCGLTRGQHVKGKPWMSARGRAGQRVWVSDCARPRA